MRFTRSPFAVSSSLALSSLLAAASLGACAEAYVVVGLADGGAGTDASRPEPALADADKPVDAEATSDASVPDAAVETFVFSDTFDTSGNSVSPVWDSTRLNLGTASREIATLTVGRHRKRSGRSSSSATAAPRFTAGPSSASACAFPRVA